MTGSGKFVRCVAISGAGLGVALLSLAGITGLVLIATSLTSSPDFSRNAATPQRLALAATLYATPSTKSGCMPQCRLREPYIVQQAKSPRSAKAVDAALKAPAPFDAAAQQRLDRTHASLSHDQLAAAFAHAKAQLAELDLKRRFSLNHRFYPAAQGVSLADAAGPDAARFGQQVAEVERSSRLALALSGAAEIRLAYAPQAAAMPTGPAMPLLAALETTAPDETAEVKLFESVPERAPLPDSRPTLEAVQPRQTRTAEREVPKPDVRKPAQSERQQTLAYAPPDDDAPSIGQAFKNLFSSSGSPSAGNGVAVYDISAQTVTLPNGQVLEAHSGVGHMADNPNYANQKMNGPTPPNTYRLVMRETRFHGVEAIRMLPVDGKNKFGRDGILAHSYLLRGRPGQSHGCVAFADYDRFLKAFKQGKIKQIVVVPGRSRGSTRIAKNGQGV